MAVSNNILASLSEIFQSINYLPEVKQLEKSFSDEDRLLIALYFRWVTMKSRDKYGITTLMNTEQIQRDNLERIEKGLSRITDWEFSGMIDFGTRGAITCSAGHPLRYGYYAYSPSTGKELVFGEKCGADFFNVDTGVLKTMQQETSKAKYELAKAFELGRCSVALVYSPVANMFNVIQSNKELAKLCLSPAYIGKTAMELWANFVARGIYPPKTLLDQVQLGYKKAARKVLSGIDSSSKMTSAISVYLETKNNDSLLVDFEIANNPGVSSHNEIIAPYSACNLFDALRASVVEEFIEPSPLSGYYDLQDVYTKINHLEEFIQSKNIKVNVSRAELIFRALTPKVMNEIHNLVDLLTLAVISDDLRLIVAMLGLSPNSTGEVPLFNTGTDIKYDAYAFHNKDTDDDALSEFYDKYGNTLYSPNVFKSCWGETRDTLYPYFRVHFDDSTGAVNTKRSIILALFLSYHDDIIQNLNKILQTPSYNGVYKCVSSVDKPTKYPDDIFTVLLTSNAESISDADVQLTGLSVHGYEQDTHDEYTLEETEGIIAEDEQEDEQFDDFSDSDVIQEPFATTEKIQSPPVSDTDSFEDDTLDDEEEVYDEELSESDFADFFDEDEDEYIDEEDEDSGQQSWEDVSEGTLGIFNMLAGGGTNGNKD